ncbi:hypothetical protein [Arboricoccus pini]|uniref:hypothetical protein n=1 Tax=Arboricoccus pini TaxID=1963835 RepID=UPI000B50E57C|nr:hypothetical protein [Arboricoccus pini]
MSVQTVDLLQGFGLLGEVKLNADVLEPGQRLKPAEQAVPSVDKHIAIRGCRRTINRADDVVEQHAHLLIVNIDMLSR